LSCPFKEKKNKGQKKLSKRARNDPVRKIINTNKNISKQKEFNNTKLLKILERIEYDRPILMKDKLDVIWGEDDLPPIFANDSRSPSPQKLVASNSIDSSANQSAQPVSGNVQSPEMRIVNEHGVKRELERRKAERAHMNQGHIKIYNKLLEYIQNRFQRVGMKSIPEVEKRNNPTRVRIHEKERQFFDAFRLIIQSGYTVDESDFMQILTFINVEEVIFNEEYEKIRQIREFLKTTARYMGFNERLIEDLFRASYFHYEKMENSEEVGNTISIQPGERTVDHEDEYEVKELINKI
jgi:hypothetical protein